ncbi:MAG: ABC transporter ATP-binding protein [Candidatus Eremiobacteraeota bacterium]|nr:ABC transporter ATP-binding protein [Candidatus Eremiobacteraeota bacterium]
MPISAGSEALRLDGVVSGYEPGVDVVRGASLRALAGAITIVIGPNGAGKSTLLRTIFGFLAPRAGTITSGDFELGGLPPHRIKALGIGYIPQQINIFPSLSVEENLKMGAWTLRGRRATIAERLDAVYDIFPALAEKRNHRSSSLSGGQARMLSVAREMMTQPQIILVDEPTAGLAPSVVPQVYAILTQARTATNAAILLVDQNVEGALEIADYVYVLDLGRVRADGPIAEFSLERTRELIRASLRG